MVRNAWLARVAVLAAAALLAGCSSEDPGEVLIRGGVEAVQSAAAEAMEDVDTARFTIERGGAPVFIDESGNLLFQEAKGRFAAPASSDAVIRVSAAGTTVEVGAVAIEGSTWLTNPVTGRWEPAPESLSFDPATMFDPELGWPRLLADGLAGATLVQPAPDEGGRYRLRGIAGADRVSVLTGGLVDQRVPLDLWIDAQTGRVEEARFEAASPDGTSSWSLVLSDYGSPVEIEPPDAVAG